MDVEEARKTVFGADVRVELLYQLPYDDVFQWCQVGTVFRDYCNSPLFWVEKVKKIAPTDEDKAELFNEAINGGQYQYLEAINSISGTTPNCDQFRNLYRFHMSFTADVKRKYAKSLQFAVRVTPLIELSKCFSLYDGYSLVGWMIGLDLESIQIFLDRLKTEPLALSGKEPVPTPGVHVYPPLLIVSGYTEVANIFGISKYDFQTGTSAVSTSKVRIEEDGVYLKFKPWFKSLLSMFGPNSFGPETIYPLFELIRKNLDNDKVFSKYVTKFFRKIASKGDPKLLKKIIDNYRSFIDDSALFGVRTIKTANVKVLCGDIVDFFEAPKEKTKRTKVEYERVLLDEYDPFVDALIRYLGNPLKNAAEFKTISDDSRSLVIVWETEGGEVHQMFFNKTSKNILKSSLEGMMFKKGGKPLVEYASSLKADNILSLEIYELVPKQLVKK